MYVGLKQKFKLVHLKNSINLVIDFLLNDKHICYGSILMEIEATKQYR